MAIEDRNLKPGMQLVARYKGKDYTCEVVKTDEGLRFRLPGGQEFKSVSAAGSHVMGGTACNGWRFWSVEGQGEKKPATASKPKSTGAKKPAPAKASGKQGPDTPTNATGSPDSASGTAKHGS